MTAFNIPLNTGRVVSPVIFDASQHLLDILNMSRFVEIQCAGGASTDGMRFYKKGQNYYFRKHGQCTINFLKDGRVHVLHGPIALWNLHDYFTNDELRILIAFATITEECQELMRNFMAPRCRKYTEVMNNMPSFQVDWKNDFLHAFSNVEI